MSNKEDPESELERFRQQWKQEVSARKGPSFKGTGAGPSHISGQRDFSHSGKAKAPTATATSTAHEQGEGPTFHDLPDKEESLKLGASEKGIDRDASSKEPRTALEHYEKAVENETAGKLGDSLKMYRKAFKMDDHVHEKYKNKHFPPSAFSSKPQQTNPSNASVTVPNTAHHSLHGLPSSVSQMMEEFSNLSIPALEPPTEASPPPPCPIAELPGEILAQVLRHVAMSNIGSFARLSLVSKRFAYLTMTEEQIWKAVTLSREQGFGGMHYKYACNIFGQPITDDDEDGQILGTDTPPEDEASLSAAPAPSFDDITAHLLGTHYLSSWRQMFRARPRIRFHGVYISTVNYTRPGGASATINTWSTPVHVVTYYRYLRFYRDGTAISLLTTAEPVDVVHILTRDNLPEPQSRDPHQTRRNHHHHNQLDKAQASRPPPTSIDKAGSGHGGPASSAASTATQPQRTDAPHALPSSAIMRDALRGRWRLSGPGDGTYPPGESEGDLHVETEGVVPKYTYKMQFGLGASSAGTAANTAATVGAQAAGTGGKRGSRNNRLVWKGFWSYNRLTDDWGEFGLKNDRAFYFSRVRSYGRGE